MTDLKKVIADFPKTNAYAVLDDLVRVCGVDSVLSALFEINAAQQSVYPDPPSACEDCGSVDEHIHYANCPLANTAGR